MRLLPALLVALVLASATAAPVAGWDATPARSLSDGSVSERITPIDNTTNHLTIPPGEIRASGYNQTGVDVGTAVAAGSRQLHQRHDAVAFEKRFRSADSTYERRQLVRSTLSAVEARRAALTRAQQTAIRQYAAGEVSASELVRTRVLVDAEARELGATLDRIAAAERLEREYSMTSGTQTRLRNLEGTLKTLHGPVGEHLHASVVGDTEESVVYVEASNTGYMFATVDGGQYVRETRLGSERMANGTDQFAQEASDDRNRLDVADERASELYPWLYERQRPSFTYYGTSGIYELTANHPNGRLTSYLDGATTNVFFERQHRRLSTVDATDSVATVNGSLRVEIDRSYETGPMLVTVTNNQTGEPVDANVHVDGRPVGATGSDGSLWSVEPRDTYTVTVRMGDGTRASVVVPER